MASDHDPQTAADAVPSNLPVLFVVDHDQASRGVPRELATDNEPVTLLLVDDAASDVLARAHELHPSA